MEKIIVSNTDIVVKEYNGQRVVTFKDIDTVHGRPGGTARKRFNDNKEHFRYGEDFFKVKCSEVRPFFGQTPPIGFNPEADVILITESGYLLLVKSFTDNLAWDIQRTLVKSYFRVKEPPKALTGYELIAAGLVEANKVLAEQTKKIETLETKIEADKPKVIFAEGVAASKNSILIGDLAKLIQQNGVPMGQKRLFEWLRKNGYLIKGGSSKNMPTQRYLEQGLFEVKISTVINPDGSNRETKTTKVTGKGQIYFLNLFMGRE